MAKLAAVPKRTHERPSGLQAAVFHETRLECSRLYRAREMDARRARQDAILAAHHYIDPHRRERYEDMR